MSFKQRRFIGGFLAVPFLVVSLAVLVAFLPLPSVGGQQKQAADPWSASETMQPLTLVKILTDKYSSVPTVVYVGFHSLYVGGHVPDAVFHGTASTQQGLAELKSWAGTVPRDKEIVLYCGCCPLEKCPNIRPAFTALRDLGFKKIQVLLLPTSFAADWAEKGYPIARGK